MELVFYCIFLSQLAQFDLHLDQFLPFCLLTTVYKELQLICSLLVCAAFLSYFSLNHCLLIQLYVQLAGLLLERVDSLRVHVFKPNELLVLR